MFNEVYLADDRLIGASVFGDGFGALADRVLGQLAGKEKAHRGLNLAARDG